MKQLNKKALRRSFWNTLGRMIGIVMGPVGACLLYQALGTSVALSVSVATLLIIGAFFLAWFADYEREND